MFGFQQINKIHFSLFYILDLIKICIMQVRVCENCYITITDHEKTPRANFFDTRYKHIVMFLQRL